MHVGIVLPIAQEAWMSTTARYGEIREVALAAEAAGLDSVWVFDHLMFRDDGVVTGIHECWTVLSAIAEATDRVGLGTIVMGTGFRNPALLAKMAATLDEISGGRVILGIGSGWYEPEYDAFGYPFDHRVGRFEEAATVITDLVRTGHADLDGRWVTARDAVLAPPARPDLPILIAARRPRMLELTARFADAWNLAWFGMPDERLAGVRAELDAACARVDRDPATLGITVGLNVGFDAVPVPAADGSDGAGSATALRGSVDDVAEGLAAHAALGVGHAIVNLEPTTPETVRLLAEAARTAGLGRLAGAT